MESEINNSVYIFNIFKIFTNNKKNITITTISSEGLINNKKIIANLTFPVKISKIILN